MTSDLDIVYDSTLYFASLASITFLSASTFSSFEALYETCAWLKAAKYDDQPLAQGTKETDGSPGLSRIA